ncbi:hypothetical protein CgunFtcFv8_003284 [Champsocephalus gunnari]|uniref:Uncharacterized protein n=1 Tax=Champsocephalus gunnari TaxID=52237 RepID=A0AAN8HJD4_CHAGU|nr:hypothetical protein CgunFtcFv8_003284 [Champsocephalus gunnari]
MVVSRLDYLQKTEITQTCQNVACPIAKRTCNSVDIICADFGNIQADVNKWANESLQVLPCKRDALDNALLRRQQRSVSSCMESPVFYYFQ